MILGSQTKQKFPKCIQRQTSDCEDDTGQLFLYKWSEHSSADDM